jgi:hypothetical protein
MTLQGIIVMGWGTRQDAACTYVLFGRYPL